MSKKKSTGSNTNTHETVSALQQVMAEALLHRNFWVDCGVTGNKDFLSIL